MHLMKSTECKTVTEKTIQGIRSKPMAAETNSSIQKRWERGNEHPFISAQPGGRNVQNVGCQSHFSNVPFEKYCTG